MIGQIVRDTEYGTGICVHIRTKPDKDRTVVYAVTFSDAPGGRESFEMEAPELIKGAKQYLDFIKSERHLPEYNWDP